MDRADRKVFNGEIMITYTVQIKITGIMNLQSGDDVEYHDRPNQPNFTKFNMCGIIVGYNANAI